jgi:hypothetical protein
MRQPSGPLSIKSVRCCISPLHHNPCRWPHPSPQRPLTTAECATVSKTYHSLPLCACLDGRPNPAASRTKHGRDLPPFLTRAFPKRWRRRHGRMPPCSGSESCSPIKPTLPVDGRAFQPVWGVLHRYRGCSLAIVSTNPEGCYPATAPQIETIPVIANR